jgi:membrane protein YdbS with pleckstrin-like domain
MTIEPVPERIRALDRPHPALWAYYMIRAVLTGPALVVLLPYLYFRYHTLRYRFDEEGIHMKVGLLFRRETNLTYARIQDIHLRSGLLQRWLGLANVQIQTASGSAGPELVIEGFKEFEAVRDFLYTRMRGYQARTTAPGPAAEAVAAGAAAPARHDVSAAAPASSSAGEAEMVSLLLGIRDELRRTRELLEAQTPALRPPPTQAPPIQPPPHV